MKGLNLNRLAVAAMTAAIFTTTAVAQQQKVEPAVPQREIIVSLEDHKLALVENGEVKMSPIVVPITTEL